MTLRNQIIPYPHSGKLENTDLEILKRILVLIESDSDVIDDTILCEWLEKIISMVELNRNSLRKTLKNRFNDAAAPSIILSILNSQSRRTPIPNLRGLNAALWLRDAFRTFSKPDDFAFVSRGLDDALFTLPARIRKRGPVSWCLNPMPSNTSEHSIRQCYPGNVKLSPVTILSPNYRSLNTIVTIHCLNQIGVPISSILVRRLLSARRISEELNFSPSHLLQRVSTELTPRRKRTSNSSVASLSGYANSIGCYDKTVEEIANRIGAKVHYYSNFNDDNCLDQVRKLNPSIGVFTGGGILKSNFLSCFQNGIVHAHPGILPTYKGMDVVQWAILEGEYDNVGSTCQIMTSSLDGGSTINLTRVSLKGHNTLNSIRSAVVTAKIKMLCDSVFSVARDEVEPIVQNESKCQYRLMHPRLTEITNELIVEGIHDTTTVN